MHRHTPPFEYNSYYIYLDCLYDSSNDGENYSSYDDSDEGRVMIKIETSKLEVEMEKVCHKSIG